MPPLLHLVAPLLAQATTSTTSVPRIQGEPLDPWVVIAASVVLLVVILVAGFAVNRRIGDRG